jgi:hypothetical protein
LPDFRGVRLRVGAGRTDRSACAPYNCHSGPAPVRLREKPALHDHRAPDRFRSGKVLALPQAASQDAEYIGSRVAGPSARPLASQLKVALWRPKVLTELVAFRATQGNRPDFGRRPNLCRRPTRLSRHRASDCFDSSTASVSAFPPFARVTVRSDSTYSEVGRPIRFRLDHNRATYLALQARGDHHEQPGSHLGVPPGRTRAAADWGLNWPHTGSPFDAGCRLRRRILQLSFSQSFLIEFIIQNYRKR